MSVTEDSGRARSAENLTDSADTQASYAVTAQVRQYSPLTLAYTGDAAYELVIRTMLVRRANQPVHQLHRQASSLVKAEKQSEMAGILEPLLTEEEAQIYRRGRNARANTHARSAGIQEYRRATGFEAVIGFLWLSGRKERMLDLIAAGLQISREEIRFE